MNYDRFLNPDIAAVPPSGIRRFFDLASSMRDTISLGVGEPDFRTPYHIRNAAINSLLDGETQYTPNRGLLSLRKEISRYLARSRGIEIPAGRIVVGSGAEYLYGLIAQLFGKDRTFAVEDPSYSKIRKVYTAFGIPCEYLRLGPDGIPTAELER